MNDDSALIERLVQDIRRAGGVSRAPVEKATGLHLEVAGEGAYTRSYSAPPIRSGASSYVIDLREPKPGSGATGGALLVLQVTGGCTKRATLEARYGDLQLTDIPRGRSPDEQSYWTKREPWGELSFGFAERAPDCLSSVVFKAADAP